MNTQYIFNYLNIYGILTDWEAVAYVQVFGLRAVEPFYMMVLNSRSPKGFNISGDLDVSTRGDRLSCIIFYYFWRCYFYSQITRWQFAQAQQVMLAIKFLTQRTAPCNFVTEPIGIR